MASALKRRRKRSSFRLALLMLAAAAGLFSLLLFSDQFRSFLRTQIFVGAPDVYIGPPVTYTAPAAYLIDNTTQTGQGFAASSGGRQGWTYDTTSGYEKDYHWSYPGRGENKATWTFGKLPPGQYLVQATWTANSRRATNAPYTVSDGKSALVTTAVNQRSAPRADTAVGSTTFQNLGNPVNVNSGTLVVTLTNAANGYVVADAVRVASIIKAQTPNEDSLSGQDWSLPKAPSVDVTLGDPVEICPAVPAGEDNPLSLPMSRFLPGREAQAQVNLCQRGHIGVLPRKYESKILENKYRTSAGSQISNPSAADIIDTICQSPPPGCDAGTTGCSVLGLSSRIENVRRGALWEKINNVYRLVAGTVYPGPNQAGVLAPAVYPAAPAPPDNVITFIKEMHLWSLSPADESVLRAAHPTLVALAHAIISNYESHEERHWAIHGQTVPWLLEVINNPRVPGSPQPSLAGLQSAIIQSFTQHWQDIIDVTERADDAYHDDVSPKEDLTVDTVPVDDYLVSCKFAADFVTNVGVVIDPLKAGFVSSRPLGTTRSGVTGIDGCEAQCSVIYLTGTQVTMLATPKSGYRFAKWLGDACPCNGSANKSCSFTVSRADSLCTALFAKAPAIQPPPPSTTTPSPPSATQTPTQSSTPKPTATTTSTP